MERASKAGPRIEACGTVDEGNALVGVVRPTGHDFIDDQLRESQNPIHIVQADFANPDPDEDDPRVTDGYVDTVESRIDNYGEELGSL